VTKFLYLPTTEPKLSKCVGEQIKLYMQKSWWNKLQQNTVLKKAGGTVCPGDNIDGGPMSVQNLR